MNDELKINPELLKWPPEESGFSKTEVANKVHITRDQYEIRESNGTEFSLEHLITLSKVCKRQIAFFFLSNISPRIKKPTDYRILEPHQSRLTEEALLAMKHTVKFHDFLLHLHGLDYYEAIHQFLHKRKTSGAILFGVVNAFVSVVIAAFLTDLSGIVWSPVIWAIILIGIVSTFLGLFSAVSVSEIFKSHTFSNFFRFPMIFLFGLFFPITVLPVFSCLFPIYRP